jgi:hypothetical protein
MARLSIAVACAGAPTANKTYFCDAGSGNCYTRNPAANYSDAAALCESLPGQLVAYSSREKQLLVGACAAPGACICVCCIALNSANWGT